MISRDDHEPDPQYCAEVTEELKNALRHGYFRAGELLLQISSEGLFGRWGSFRDFVVGELRISEVQAYRLIFAHEMNRMLTKHGCHAPENERHLRPLRNLKEEGLRILAWERACQQKQGSSPTAADVMREVKRLSNHLKPDEEMDANFRAFRQAFESARSEYARAHQLLEEGNLEAFLACDDKTSVSRRHRMEAALGKLASLLASDSVQFASEAEETEE